MTDPNAPEATALSYVATVMFAIAILFPLFIWLSVAIKG